MVLQFICLRKAQAKYLGKMTLPKDMQYKLYNFTAGHEEGFLLVYKDSLAGSESFLKNSNIYERLTFCLQKYFWLGDENILSNS